MNSMHFNISNPGIIVSLLNDSVKPIFLLGAGASKQSGVKLVNEIVEEAAKWAYCKDHGYRIDDPRITMSDWKKWLTQFPWYTEDYGTLYPIIVEELLNPRQTRKDFFLKIIRPQIPVSKGYEVLAELMHIGLIDTVLTTNFDNCLYDASVQVRKQLTHIIKTPSDLSQLSYTPRYSQLVYLHGSVEHYTDQNLNEETRNLNSDLVTKIKPLLKDRPLVIIGYRGFETSVMQDLFLNNIIYTNSFHQGIYWCLLKREVDRIDSDSSVTTNYFRELARAVRGNFKVIPIDGFDELMEREILGKLKANEIDLRSKQHFDGHSHRFDSDLEIIGSDTLGPLEIALLRERVNNYSERLRIKVYDDLDWLHQQMYRLKLAGIGKNGKPELTFPGILLFSSRTQELIPNSSVLVKFIGKPAWLRKVTTLPSESEKISEEFINGEIERVITGNLWTQLNEITDALTLINRPFRLKGEISDSVYPYPNLALKEIIVNSLVHRDYFYPDPVVIEIYSTHITFRSPGGLVEEVKRQIGLESIQEEIRKGKRGIKGYRNPVLADLFYGSGAMDKEGSGLSDVYRTVQDNSGTVFFGPTPDERYFEVKIFCRPEAVDDLTMTASPLIVSPTRFACNLFEILSLPETIYHADTDVRKAAEIFKKSKAKWHPPFVLQDQKIWSFYDLSSRSNPLNPFIDTTTAESISIEEFVEIKGGTKELVWLLNDSILQHLFSIGLRVDKAKKRAYFTKTYDDTSKEITYQGRLKRATRTVARARINPTSGKISYWEHKSIWYHFENFGETWFLVLNPAYVFTTDGVKNLLKSERVNVLSTKKASRDYNMAVHNDFTFWAKYIANGVEGPFQLRPNIRLEEGDREIDIAHPAIVITSALPTTVINDITVVEEFIEPTGLDDIEDLERELEMLAEHEQRKIEQGKSGVNDI
jgi:hypothetical protein